MSTIERRRVWLVPPDPDYPDSDGEPLAENTTQYEWIVRIVGGLRRIFRDDPNVFVAGDLFWYPVEGHAEIRTAPDAMVALGRPKGERSCYKQWVEGGVPPQVVFEVLSPSNRPAEMARKLLFYEQYGVQEYYLYDPGKIQLEGYLRDNLGLRLIPVMHGWISPRLGIRFDRGGPELVILGPDDKPFLTYDEVSEDADEQRDRIEEERQRADEERRRADEQQRRATVARQQAEQARQQAEQARQLADAAVHQADAERRRSERLLAQLRALGIEPEGA